MPKVLIIDEKSHMLELLQAKFEVEGFEVFTAASAEEGLAIAGREPVDLIVLDERLQDPAGESVVERLKGDPGTSEIPVILLTPRASRAGAGGDAGASLQLPFRPSQLVALVRENL